MIDPDQIEAVRDSFVAVLVDPDRAARLFYDRLFELAPDTRALFTGDMATQGKVLIQTLATVVTGLHRFDAMTGTLRQLALRHEGYGVQIAHYDAVGTALLDMLTHICGPAFDAPTRAAWEGTYALIAATMIAATRPAAN